jgi:hypothetical protein
MCPGIARSLEKPVDGHLWLEQRHPCCVGCSARLPPRGLSHVFFALRLRENVACPSYPSEAGRVERNRLSSVHPKPRGLHVWRLSTESTPPERPWVWWRRRTKGNNCRAVYVEYMIATVITNLCKGES